MRVLCLLFLASWFIANLANSAVPKLSERSRFTQGLWWDDSRSGSGFELHQFGSDAFLVWYTYRSDQTPVWYTAQGPLDALGGFEAKLYEQSMEAGIRTSAEVGRVVVANIAPERLRLTWTLGDTNGEWSLAPYRASARPSEQDSSGLWWQPERSGYGVGISDTGSYQTLAIYAYDVFGRATWMFGSRPKVDGESPERDLELQSFRGSCPSCRHQSSQVSTKVSAQLTFLGPNRAELNIPVQAPLGNPYLGSRTISSFSRTGTERAADQMLAQIDDAQELRRHLARVFSSDASPHTLARCFRIFAAAAPEGAASEVNRIVTGVDEAALLRADRGVIYALIPDERELRIARMNQGVIELGETLTRAISPDQFIDTQKSGMFLTNELLIITESSYPQVSPCGGRDFGAPVLEREEHTTVELFDRGNPLRPVAKARLTLDGTLIAARMIGNQLFLITRATAQGYQGLKSIEQTSDLNQNIATLGERPLRDLLPRMLIGNQEQLLVKPEQIYVPPSGHEYGNDELTTVTRIPLASPEQFESVSVLGRTLDVHVAEANVYLLSSRQSVVSLDLLSDNDVEGAYGVDIHQVSLSGPQLRVIGTGTAEGSIIDPFSGGRAPWRYSEHQGQFRLMTATFAASGEERNRLTILEPSNERPGFLRTVSTLPNSKRTATIGKPREALYGTRFVGDRLYAVTFRRIDPLYVIDLSQPRDPRIVGELELPGFSEYLHPIAPDILLGVGMSAQDAGDQPGDGQFAWLNGVQVSLFDVSNASQPREIQRLELGRRGTYTELFSNHQAFSIFSQAGNHEIAFPVVLHDSPTPQPRPSDYAPFKEAGLYRFQINGSGSSTRIQALPSLITQRPLPDQVYSQGQYHARSIIFDDSVVYFENGKFHVMRRNGSEQRGPL